MTSSGWPGSRPGGDANSGWPGPAGPPPPPTSGSGWGATPPGAGWGGAQSAGGSGGSSGGGWSGAGGQGAQRPGAASFQGPDWSGATGAAQSAGGPAGSWTPPAAGDADASVDARPPMMWLWAAIAGPVIGVALIFAKGWGWNVAGWAAAVVLGLGLLVVFTSVDLRRRTSPWYLARPGVVGGLRLAVAAGAIIVAGIHAYLLADYIARLDWWA